MAIRYTFRAACETAKIYGLVARAVERVERLAGDTEAGSSSRVVTKMVEDLEM
jgi:hypothetical protein